MGSPKVRHYRNSEELARGVAEKWLEQLPRSASSPHCVALLGGRIAKPFYEAVVRSSAASSQDWAQVHFFWSDERCVPPDDPASNFAVALEFLLKPLRIAGNRIHRIRGEEAPEQAAKLASADLERIAEQRTDGQPVLDHVFLGMGEDGHVASLFPGETEAAVENSAVFRSVSSLKPPPQRVTIGYRAIAAAREVWVLVSGEGKSLALEQALKGGAVNPLGRILKVRSQTRVFADVMTAPQ